MYIIPLCQQIFRELWLHKLRSILALFCITWGTLTVILLLALGDGFQVASKKNMLSIADGAFFIIPTRTSIAYQGFPKRQPIKIQVSDIINIKQSIPSLIAATPILTANTKLGAGTREAKKNVFGVSLDFSKIRKLELTEGSRFLTPFDIENNERVAIIGDKLKREFFKDQNAIGKTITINSAPFKIVGTLEPPAKATYSHYDNSAIITYVSFMSLYDQKNANFIAVLPDSKLDPDTVEQNLRNYFAYQYHFSPQDKKALKIFSSAKIFQFFTYFFIGIKLFLLACGTLTLGVGCLGVTNIMFLIVTERTKEIGLRMSLGATDANIFSQIMLEALAITSIGGFLGFLLSASIITTLQHIPLPEWIGVPTLSTPSAFVTIFILIALGLIAGYLPAKRAAKMDPITALGFHAA
ncbi:MAG: ABC transporter permease [Gammaproteobacteria bacterium]